MSVYECGKTKSGFTVKNYDMHGDPAYSVPFRNDLNRINMTIVCHVYSSLLDLILKVREWDLKEQNSLLYMISAVCQHVRTGLIVGQSFLQTAYNS